MSMDSRDQLPLDMVEQMLKFTPSSEEAAHLEEHSEEIDSLARADRFLYEISKYDQHCSILPIHYYYRGNRCMQSELSFASVQPAASHSIPLLTAYRSLP